MSSAAPEYAFATPFLNPPASPIRSLMPYAMRPGTISLAGGYPAPELFDVDGLSLASSQVMAPGRVPAIFEHRRPGQPAP